MCEKSIEKIGEREKRAFIICLHCEINNDKIQ